MPNTPQAKHFWLDETHEEIIVSSNHVHDQMLLNVSIFGSPPIAMTVFAAAIARANSAYGNRANGPEAELEVTAAFAALVVILLSLANYVSLLAAGNVLTIVKAGFEATFTTSNPAVRPAQGNKPTGKSIPGGFVKLKTNKVAGASNYFWVIYTGAIVAPVIVGKVVKFPLNSGVILIPIGNTTEDLEGFVGEILKVGVFAFNAAGFGGMSDLFTLQTQA
jgi:hypothetical protein